MAWNDRGWEELGTCPNVTYAQVMTLSRRQWVHGGIRVTFIPSPTLPPGRVTYDHPGPSHICAWVVFRYVQWRENLGDIINELATLATYIFTYSTKIPCSPTAYSPCL